METRKKRLGDRRDGYLIRDIDSMHFVMPLIFPNRCDNEAYISEKIDITNIKAWLAEKNVGEDVFPYTMFHVIVGAILKTVTLRPKMNRFIANKNMYQRNEVSAAFVVKKLFTDDSDEALAFIHAEDSDTIFTIHDKLYEQVSGCRSDKVDSSSDSMNMFNRMPRFLGKALINTVRVLDVHGKVPLSLIETDPFYSSVVLSNLGSIKMKCGYHHLANWGTNSLFCIVGERKMSPFYDADGNVELRETVELGLTIDERLADGYYYSKSVRLLKKLLEDPQLLEKPLNEKVEY